MKEVWLNRNTVITLKETSIMYWMRAQSKEEITQLMGIVNYKRDK
jgi:ferritin